MCFISMAWAVKQKTANSGQKLVLLLLADITNADTGQCNPSHQTLADKCCMSTASIKRHIDDLVQLGFLSKVPVFKENIQKSNQYILNIPGSSNCTPPQLNLNPTPAHIELQNLEVKPIKEPIKEFFDKFWSCYPRKDNKALAMKMFNKLKVDQELLNTMLKSLAIQVPQWNDPKYIPYASRWLDNKRWLDEPQFKTVYNNHGEI